jgi:hypothetical protein
MASGRFLFGKTSVLFLINIQQQTALDKNIGWRLPNILVRSTPTCSRDLAGMRGESRLGCDRALQLQTIASALSGRRPSGGVRDKSRYS